MNVESFCENFATFTEAPNGVEKLRSLVLQLAVQGKLVHQDPTDEPADKLLCRIAKLKLELERTGPKKVQDRFEEIATDELLYPIPPTWTWVRAADISRPISSGSTPAKSVFQTDPVDGVPYLKVYNIRRQKIDFEYCPQFIGREFHTTKMRRSCLVPGTVVLNIVGPPLGKTAVIPATFPEWNCNQAIAFFRFLDGVVPEYVHIYFQAGIFLRNIELIGTAGQDNISVTKCKKIVIPLPPSAEQKRIVAKVDQLLGLCDELAARQAARRESRERLVGATLDRMVSTHSSAELPKHAYRLRNNFDRLFDTPTTIPQLREAILQLAVQGQLVPQGESDEPPDRDTCVEDYLTIQNGYAFKSEWFIPDGIRLVRNVNIGHAELHWDDLACVSEERAQEFARFQLSEGDIVISLDRPLISTGLKVARLSKDDLPALLLQRVGRPQFKDSRVTPEYFFLWLNSPAFAGSIDPGKSNGVPHIAAKDIHRIRFAPPSPKTQKRIVAKVDQLLGLCDVLEEKLRHVESINEDLLASVVSQFVSVC